MAVVLGVVALVLSCGDLRKDETYCEEAVARLVDCCRPLVKVQFECDYRNAGCGGLGAQPDLIEDAARCVLDRACDDITSKGKCDSLPLESAKARSGAPGSSAETVRQEACR